MVFWGIEVKSSKPYTHRFDGERGKLHLSQATLGTGSSTKKSILQCNVGDKGPVYLCSLVAEKFENCQLNLEFEEDDDVIFSVIGPRSIHLSGFFISGRQESHRDDYESDYGEDIAETESDEATDYDSEDEYDDDFIVDDLDMYPPSPVPKSGVVIEEILDDEKLADENGIAKRGKRKILSSNSEDNGNSERQLILKSDNGASILESEDEDGFPISSPQRNKADVPGIKGKAEQNKGLRTVDASKKAEKDDRVRVESLKRKVGVILEGGEQIRKAGKQWDSSLANPEVVTEAVEKKNKKKKSKEEKTSDAGTGSKSNTLSEASTTDMEQDQPVGKEHEEKDLDIDAHFMAEEKKEKMKKKKKKSKKQKTNADTDQSVPDKIGSTKDKDREEETESKPFQVRSFPNGLVIEELAMGKPDGKKASPGKKVGVHYIGKLKKNGEIFDSNIGKAPFKFRLGVGQVIKGWDVGVNGMRVGDKRRITIPPAMGYGAKGAGQAIPPNAWLVFDVELVEVR